MKVKGISVGCVQDPEDDMAIQQFVQSEWAKTPFGELFIALSVEMTWSREYEMYAKLGPGLPFLEIFHPSFLEGKVLIIHEKNCVLSVDGVEKAVLAHFSESEKSLEPELKRLQILRDELSRASSRIKTNKAKAAIIAVFPEVANAYHNQSLDSRDLVCFTLNQDEGRHEQVYMAREIGGKFVRGITKMNMTPLHLYTLSGIERHRSFWQALALTFATNELGIPEEKLYYQKIDAEEKKFLWPEPVGYDPYIVREVLFREQFTDDQIVVTFGPDNLPASVVRRAEKAEV